MGFNPKEHITQLKGKEYLEVKWRLVWFREDHPSGSIVTDLVNINPPVVKATISDEQGRVIATGLASAKLPQSGNAVWAGREIEKAETAAIGRALAHAGYGTQFAGEDVEEGDNLADSPVEKRAAPAAKTNVVPMSQAGNAPEPANGNGHAPDLTPLTPEQRRQWFQGKLADKAVKGAMQGTITEGQQKNIAIAMSDYFKNETVRRDFLSYHFSSDNRVVDSYAKLHEKEFSVLKMWLTNTDPTQIVQEIGLFVMAAAEPAEAGG